MERLEKRQSGNYIPPPIEVSIVRRDGQIRHLNTWRKEVLWDGKTQFQIIFQDVTERKKAEEALKNSEENFRNSMDESPLGIRIVNLSGETIYTNRALLDIYGYSSFEELKEVSSINRFTPDMYENHLKMRELMKEGRTRR